MTDDMMLALRALAKEFAEGKEGDEKWIGYEFGFSTARHPYTISIKRDETFERNVEESRGKPWTAK